jgi:hypothetical protein
MVGGNGGPEQAKTSLIYIVASGQFPFIWLELHALSGGLMTAPFQSIPPSRTRAETALAIAVSSRAMLEKN